ncbi:MAG: SRPBCC family protein [Chloroflexota bacterium]
MKIGGVKELTVNASAEKVWRILAHEYDEISRWAVVIEQSTVADDLPTPDGAQVGGRVCTAQGFGQIKEKFVHYDEANMTYTYHAVEGLPSFMKRAENTWSVRSIDTDANSTQAVIKSDSFVELSFFPGIFLYPLMKWQIGRMGDRTFEELKYYIENDKPHPRKVKAQKSR